jgi:pyruvate formate lyase activating enzyme
MALARKAGIANILVSNGCINPEAAADILSLTDAANIDLKCFSAETYAKVLGGDLAAVLDFIRRAFAMGVHLEVTSLIVPGLNDSGEETGRCAVFLAGISPGIPWHLSAYHPDYQWDAPPTAPALLEETARRGRRLLNHVYTGNIPGANNDTRCAHCGETLVTRRAYRIGVSGLSIKEREGGGKSCRCARCGEDAPFSV